MNRPEYLCHAYLYGLWSSPFLHVSWPLLILPAGVPSSLLCGHVHIPGSHLKGGWLCGRAGINHVLCLAAGSGIAPIRAAIESDELGLGKVRPPTATSPIFTTPPHPSLAFTTPFAPACADTAPVIYPPLPAAVAYWSAVLRCADPGTPALQGEVRGLAGEGHGGHARLLARTRAAQLQRLLGLHPGEPATHEPRECT